jgi:hypothetical protein
MRYRYYQDQDEDGAAWLTMLFIMALIAGVVICIRLAPYIYRAMQAATRCLSPPLSILILRREIATVGDWALASAALWGLVVLLVSSFLAILGASAVVIPIGSVAGVVVGAVLGASSVAESNREASPNLEDYLRW